MAIQKVCQPDNFELYNSLKLSFTNIWGLHSNSPDIFALCETNLDDSIDSGNFSVRGYLPLIRMDFSTHMHGLAVYVKKELPFARDLSLKTLQSLTYVFNWLSFVQCLTSFTSTDYLLCLCAQFFILFHLTWMRFSPSTHLLFLSLETLKSIIRTGLPILVELKNFSNSNDLTQMVNVSTRISDWFS